MSDFLQQMATLSAERAAAAGSVCASELDKPLVPLRLGAFDIIAEIKGRSPAEGALAGDDLDRIGQARQYVEGGAAAISVLTEPSRFDGALEHLEEVAAALPDTPVMRKDFLVEPVQGEADAVVRDPVLREVIGADAFGAVATANQRAPCLGFLGLLPG